MLFVLPALMIALVINVLINCCFSNRYKAKIREICNEYKSKLVGHFNCQCHRDLQLNSLNHKHNPVIATLVSTATASAKKPNPEKVNDTIPFYNFKPESPEAFIAMDNEDNRCMTESVDPRTRETDALTSRPDIQERLSKGSSNKKSSSEMIRKENEVISEEQIAVRTFSVNPSNTEDTGIIGEVYRIPSLKKPSSVFENNLV
jgi:hypothetical protein